MHFYLMFAANRLIVENRLFERTTKVKKQDEIYRLQGRHL